MRERAAPAPKVGVIADAGPAYILNPDGQSCYGQDGRASDNTLQTDFAAGTQKYDTPAIPRRRAPELRRASPAGRSFLAPAAGLLRALDLAVTEYQGGQDFMAGWEPDDAASSGPAARRRSTTCSS